MPAQTRKPRQASGNSKINDAQLLEMLKAKNLTFRELKKALSEGTYHSHDLGKRLAKLREKGLFKGDRLEGEYIELSHDDTFRFIKESKSWAELDAKVEAAHGNTRGLGKRIAGYKEKKIKFPKWMDAPRPTNKPQAVDVTEIAAKYGFKVEA